MPIKINLENFIAILRKKNLRNEDIKEILKEIGLEEEKINKLIPTTKKDTSQENIEKINKITDDSILDLEKEIISLNFDLNNLKTVFDSYKRKVNDLEKRINDIDNKISNIFTILEENIPALIKKNNERNMQ